jgi:WS/DGAT/MGAT family acyltransferase
MKQLSPIDSIFVYNEQSNTPLHISPIMIYDPSTAENGFVRFKDILETFRSRLQLSPVFRRKLVKVPLNLDRPYWVEDEDFDLEFHVRHIALPKPGDWRQFHILLARLHSRPVDLSRPPWEAYIIEGLDNIEGLPPGCFAMYMKIHHSAIDGATGNQIVEALHDPSPVPGDFRKEDNWEPEASPGNLTMLSHAYFNLLKQPSKIFNLVKHTIESLDLPTEIGQKRDEMEDHGIKDITRFNHEVSPHRVFGAVPFELDRLKVIKNAIGGCTLNDVILSITSGAMRCYLAAHDELPESSLIAGVPMSTRSSNDVDASGGNSVSGMRISLRTDIADPVERLKKINKDAVASKVYANAVGARRLVDIAESIPSSVAALGMRVVSATGLSSRMPMIHTIVTNVPGPQVPIYMCGAKGLLWLGAGVLIDGMGLFTTINSYNGKLSIAFISDRAMMPDPEFYEECIRESYRDLERAALKSAVAAKAKTVRKKTTRKKTAGKKTAGKKTVGKKTARKKTVGKKTGKRKKAG